MILHHYAMTTRRLPATVTLLGVFVLSPALPRAVAGPNPSALRITLGVRETKTTSPVGEDGGVADPERPYMPATIEWIGATTIDSCNRPVGKLLTPSTEWQTLTWYPLPCCGHPADPILPATGDGVLDYASPSIKRAVLEHLAIVPVRAKTGPFKLYIDNVKSGSVYLAGTNSPGDVSSFEVDLPGTQQVMFRNPDFLDLLPDPCFTVIDNTVSDNGGNPAAGTQSLRVEWQFATASCPLLRLTTYSLYGNPSDRYPNPTIALDQPLTVRFLLLPADSDSDGISNDADNCPAMANADQADAESDGVGDACDNCINTPNPNQANADGDNYGNACDNCPNTASPDQTDTDGDWDGDACDNCVNTPNSDQANADGDDYGDLCDSCPTVANNSQVDADSDTIGDACDNCPAIANLDQANSDGDGAGDLCDDCANDPAKTAPGQCGCGIADADADSDSVADCNDNCDLAQNPGQEDPDSDGLGTACDICPDNADPAQLDSDSDGKGDVCDNCPAVANAGQEDADSDGVGDSCDNCMLVANPSQEDADSDGTGNACESRSIIAWQSIRTHGGTAGEVAIELDATPAAGTVDPRDIGGNHRIRVIFDGAITLANSAGVTVTSGSGSYVPAVAVTGDTMELTFATPLPSGACYTITIGPAALQEALPSGADNDCMLRILYGDTTGNGEVNLGDVLYVRSKIGQPESHLRFDVDLSGAIDDADLAALKALVSQPPAVAACPQ